MSHPLPTGSFTVRPDAVAALGTELRALAAELTDDAESVRRAAGTFSAALGGDEGWIAGGAASAWAGLQEVLAARTGAVAGTLLAAAAAYREEDAALAGRDAPGRPPR